MGRKGKQPASSAKALEVCGDNPRLGISAADVFAQFGDACYVASPVNSAVDEATVVGDAEISLALHALQKKDPTTRLRGVGELQQVLSTRSTSTLREACSPFLHLYRRLWPQDAEPRVREGLQRCLQVLVESLQKDFAKHLRAAFPTWLCAMFDAHTEVAQAARRAFASAFTTDERRRGVFRHCQADCLVLLSANLRHSEQSLHEELGIGKAPAAGDKNAALERQDRFARVIAASLGGLGELVHVCAASGPTPATKPLTAEDLESLLVPGSESGLWPRLAGKQPPLVRRAAAECLVRVLQSPAHGSCNGWSSVRGQVFNSLADDAIAPAMAATLVRSFADAWGAECWDGLSASKAVWPQLLAAARRGAPRDSMFLGQLPRLLGILPKSAWTPGRGEALMAVLLEALSTPRVPAAEVWRNCFAVVNCAGAAGAAVSSAWRWSPVELYLYAACGGTGRPATSGSLECTKERSNAATDAAPKAACPPLVSLPPAVIDALPSVLAAELPTMLSHSEATEELLSMLQLGAPPVDATTSTRTAGQWKRWLALLAPFLVSQDGPAVVAAASSESQGLSCAAEKHLAAQFRRLLLRALALPVDDLLETAAPPLLVALGHLVTCDVGTVNHHWIAAEDDELKQALAKLPAPATPALPEAAASWPGQACLIAWPLLQWWQGLLAVDATGKAAAALGRHVIHPLLSHAVKKHGSKFPSAAVGDLIVSGLLGSQHELAQGGPAPPGLAAAARVILEHLPSEMAMAAAMPLRAAAARLAELVASGDSSGGEALRLALQPGGLPIEEVQTSLEVLLRSAEAGGEGALTVALLCGEVLTTHSKHCNGAVNVEKQEDVLRALREPAGRALLRAVVNDSENRDKEGEIGTQAWPLLQQLLPGLAHEGLCDALGPPPALVGPRRRWVRALREISTASGIPLCMLLCECRGGVANLQPHGQVVAQELAQNAQATSEVLRASSSSAPMLDNNAMEKLEENTVAAVFALLWELLLAEAILPSESGFSQAGISELLGEFGPRAQVAFVRFCALQTASEGCRWWLSIVPEQPNTGKDNPSHISLSGLHSPAALRLVLERAWQDAEIANNGVAAELLSLALHEVQTAGNKALGWGPAAAAVASRLSLLSSPELRGDAASAQSAWRSAVATAAANPDGGQSATTGLLKAAAAVEVWAANAQSHPAVASTVGSGIEVCQTPLITDAEPQAASNAIAAEASSAEAAEVDTTLIEAHERFLRCATARGASLDLRDAFASYAAATWSSVAAATPGLSSSSRPVTRMHRFALELLSDARREEHAKAAPGGLRLAAAMSALDLWPESCWPPVLEAIKDVSLLKMNFPRGASNSSCNSSGPGPPVSLPPVAEAFIDDASCAAADLLQYVPATSVRKVVQLLSASHYGLSSAAAARLRSQDWVPRDRNDAAVSGKDLLAQFESLLQEQEAGGGGTPVGQATDDGSSCADVAFAVLGALTGSELASAALEVEDALAAFLSWESEVSADPDESGSEDDPSTGDQSIADLGATVANPAHLEDPASGITTRTAAQMPLDCLRRCVSVLSAWELVLRDLRSSSRQPSPEADPGSGGNDNGATQMTPSELVCAALQLTPDQLTGARSNQSWPTAPAPCLEAARAGAGRPPALPLMRLLCHALTCERLAGGESIEDLLAAEVPKHGSVAHGDKELQLRALATRTLLLALQVLPGTARCFWEGLPRRRDRDIVEKLVARSFCSVLIQAEAAAAAELLEVQKDRLPGVEALVVRRRKELALQITRDELRAELCIAVPDAFPLKTATAEAPERTPGVPKPRVRNWMLQARQVLAGRKPASVGRVMVMWARSFALFFEGVEDCPICYNVVHLSTQTIPRKACPTCKHKFHNECLYHWFKTSSKTTCPLCQQPF